MSIQINSNDGKSISLAAEIIDSFSASLRGELLSTEQPKYAQARQVWNGMINKYPALIACCTGATDVVTAVTFARDHNLLLSVKGGGHNIAGSAVCDGGLMLDLSAMNGVVVDVKSRTVQVQSGALLGDIDHET